MDGVSLTRLTDKGPIPRRPLGMKHVRCDLISWPTPTGSFTQIPPKYVPYFPISSVIHRQPKAHRHAQDPFQELEAQGRLRGKRRNIVRDPALPIKPPCCLSSLCSPSPPQGKKCQTSILVGMSLQSYFLGTFLPQIEGSKVPLAPSLPTSALLTRWPFSLPVTLLTGGRAWW